MSILTPMQVSNGGQDGSLRLCVNGRGSIRIRFRFSSPFKIGLAAVPQGGTRISPQPAPRSVLRSASALEVVVEVDVEA